MTSSPLDELYTAMRNITQRISAVETREERRVANSTVAALPAPSATFKGRLRFVTNGRKVGEGAGAGTGTLVYDDGTAWRRVADDTTVVA